MISKLRLILLTIVIAPQLVMFAAAHGSYLAADKYFNQVEAVSLAAALFLALALPGLIAEWLIVKPLFKVKSFCLEVKKGNYAVRLKLPNETTDGDGEDEFIVLMRNLNWMVRQIQIREQELKEALQHLSDSHHYIDKQNRYLLSINKKLLAAKKNLQKRGAELESAYQKMQHMAMTDPLTGIANRRCFFRELNRQLKAMAYWQQPLSMVMLDIDYFKRVNDTYGHDAGDQVLFEIGILLRHNTRKKDLIARVGGEEYAILLPGADEQEALQMVARIKAAAAAHVFETRNADKITITISAGVCTLACIAGISRDNLYTFTDKALYFSKRNGRNSISTYNPYSGEIKKADCA